MYFKYKKYSVLCAAIVAMGLNAAHAEDSGDKMFSFSGFGSVGVVNSSAHDADYATAFSSPTGSGRTDNWSSTQMSRLGMQVDAKFNEQLSGVIQAVSEFNYDKSYNPNITEANIKYQATQALSLRAGRFYMPLYMLTEFSRVGYALPWALPPQELYVSAPSVDGIDATYKFSLGDVALTTQAYYGQGKLKVGTNSLPDPITLDLPTAGFNLTADYGASTFRIARTRAKITEKNPTIDGYFNLYRQHGLSALADQYQVNGDIYFYDDIGYSYDPGSWFMRTEIVNFSGPTTTIFPTAKEAYVTAGFRTGKFTPYAIYGVNKNTGPTSIGANDPLGAINALLSANNNSRHSISVGTRWDFRDNMDLKLQYTQVIRGSSSSTNGLINQVSGTTTPSSYNLIFAGVDFVF